MKCSRCKKVASYEKINTITRQFRYGNPYYEPQYTIVAEEMHHYACKKHYLESVSTSIGGPHKWKEIKEK